MLKIVRYKSKVSSMRKNRLHYRIFHADRTFMHAVSNLLSFGVFVLCWDSGFFWVGLPFLVLALASIALHLIQSSKKCTCLKRVVFAPLHNSKLSKKVTLLLLPPILIGIFSSFLFHFSYGYAFIFIAIWLFACSGKIKKWSSSPVVCAPEDLNRQDIDDLPTEKVIDLISCHLQMNNYEKAEYLSRRLLQKLDDSS